MAHRKEVCRKPKFKVPYLLITSTASKLSLLLSIKDELRALDWLGHLFMTHSLCSGSFCPEIPCIEQGAYALDLASRHCGIVEHPWRNHPHALLYCSSQYSMRTEPADVSCLYVFSIYIKETVIFLLFSTFVAAIWLFLLWSPAFITILFSVWRTSGGSPISKTSWFEKKPVIFPAFEQCFFFQIFGGILCTHILLYEPD